MRRGTRSRARRSTPRSTSSPTSSSPGTPTHHPQVCPPALLAATHAARAAFGRHCRFARDRCTCCRCTCARAPSAPASAPTMCSPRGARTSARDATCARDQHVRMRRLACFVDCLRVAPPVQAAAAARPPRPRHPRHDQQTRRRHHCHEDPAAGTPAGSAAWPRRREACACEAVPVKPVIRTRSSSRLRPRRRTAQPAHHRVQRRRLRPDHYRHDRHNKHHHGLVEA